MNLDEELFLSAYLDGVLDPEPSRRVDAALEADPRLADDLRVLTAVRDLVAGLSRPAPGVDVAPAVLDRIERRKSSVPRVFRLALSRPNAWAAAAAVVLLATLAVAAFSSRRNAGTLAGTGARNLRRPDPRTAPVDPRGLVTPPDSTRDASPTNVTQSPSAPTPASVAFGPDAAERQRDAEQQKLRHLLDSPNVRKVFRLADVVSDVAGRQVQGLLDKSPRRFASYVCIAIAPGVGPDTTRRGPAKVFVAVMDEVEVNDFRKDLQTTFLGGFRETEPNPDQLTQLAEIAQIDVFPGKSVSGVTVPENGGLALRNDKPPETLQVLAQIEDAAANSGPTPEQELSAPIHSLEGRGSETANGNAPEPPLRPAVVKNDKGSATRRPVSVVLVWVPVAPRSGRDSP